MALKAAHSTRGDTVKYHTDEYSPDGRNPWGFSHILSCEPIEMICWNKSPEFTYLFQQRKTMLNAEFLNEVKQLREQYSLKVSVQVQPIIILKHDGEASVN